MQKPQGYDEAKAAGDFTPVELGGHFCTIKQVAEKKSQTGKDMVVVVIDFCAPDAQPDYFKRQFESDDRPDKKWPYNGTRYIMVNDYNDSSKTSRDFKTFCTCFEKSNNCKIAWGSDNWGAQFKNKKIGAVYGEEEHEYDGKVSKRRTLRWFCEFDKAKDASIPNFKPLKNKTTGSSAGTLDGFISVPDDSDEEIPF